MSNDLIPADVFGEVTTQLGSDEDFADLGSSKFLQRLELKSSGQLINEGKVRPGHYAVIISSDDAVDLGDSIDIMPLARRAKAIDMSDPNNIVVSFDRNSDVFKSIEKRSSIKDSRCQYGASFLVVERSTGKLYEMFLGSASNRREVGTFSEALPLTAASIKAKKLEDVKPHGPLAMALKSKLVKNEQKGYSWFVIVPKPCSNPFTKKQIPEPDVIKTEIEKFLNPEQPEAEAEAPPEDGGKKRAR